MAMPTLKYCIMGLTCDNMMTIEKDKNKMNNIKMSKQAVKLLGDNEGDSLYGDMGIRKGEYDGITHARLMNFIDSYPVMNVSINNNSYGKFQFISLKVKCYMYNGESYDDCLQFWGNGYHEYRGVLMVNWQINAGNVFLIKDKTPMNKAEVKKLISDYRLSVGIGDGMKQSKSGNQFETFADLTDDDSALSSLYY